MVYYRSMRGFRAAINRRVKIWCYLDDGILSGCVELLHKERDVMSKIADIMQRVHCYDSSTVYYAHGFYKTKIRVIQLSEVVGPIPTEFLTTK